MIRKITGQNNNAPTKQLTHNNLKITDEKDIANHLTETFSQNSSAKNQSKSFQIIKTKAEKVKTKFQSKKHRKPQPTFLYSRTKRIPQQGPQYNSWTRQNTLSVPERIAWNIQKFPPTNLQWFMEQWWHTLNMERNHSYTDAWTFQRQYKYKKLQTYYSY